MSEGDAVAVATNLYAYQFHERWVIAWSLYLVMHSAHSTEDHRACEIRQTDSQAL
jgi:hypothetical protein